MDSFDVSCEIECLLAGESQGRGGDDGVTAAADATFTSAADAAFTAADVGKNILIVGAGTGGVDFVSTILTYTSATSIEMADTADVTVNPAVFRIYETVNLATAVPIDLASQFKPGISDSSPYAVISSVALPFLYVESMSYRFGLRDNANQSATLRGDSIFYNPGPVYVQTAAGTNSANQTVISTNPAYQYSGDGNPRRALSVTVGSTRLTKDVDYSESYGSITSGAAVTTVTVFDAVPTTSNIRVVYASPTAKSYLQAVHADTTVKPAAVRGKDINVYVGGYDPNDVVASAANKWTQVQSVNIDWRVTIEKDEEFGNYYATGSDFDVPELSGSIEIKPTDPDALLDKIREASGETDPFEILGAQTSTPLELDIVINDPDTQDVVKRMHVPDARFTVPGYQGRVQQKLTVTMNFESDGGTLEVTER